MVEVVSSRTYSPQHSSHIVTVGGWARSGKGTAMTHIRNVLEQVNKRVVLIDQGVKFRAMAEVALFGGQTLDSLVELNDFISSNRAQEATLAVLDEIAGMDETDKKARLYTTEMSKASGKVGKVASAHEIAVRLLRSQVEAAVEAKTDVILFDGRSVDKYARQFTEEGLAKFAMGWFFKCDPAIAARRSLGLFDPLEDLTAANKVRLLAETFGISDRNRADALREVEPMQEPKLAYHLDFATYDDIPTFGTPYKRSHDILHNNGLAVADTSYTNSIEEMTMPVTELTKFGLMWRGLLSHEDVGIGTATVVGS